MDVKLIEKLVGTLMMSRTYAHLAHLKTSSYAKHVALDEFYSSIIDMVDSVAEVAQGKYGKLDFPYLPMKGDVADPINGLESHLVSITNIGKKCEDRALSAILDDILVTYSTALYKLKELD